MKKLSLIFLALLMFLTSCKIDETQRIRSIMFDEVNNEDRSKLSTFTEIDNQLNIEYPDKIAIYKATPRNFTEADFEVFRNYFNMNSDDFHITSKMRITNGEITFSVDGNEILYDAPYPNKKITKTEEELKQEAEKILRSLPFVKDEYVYSTTSTRTKVTYHPDETKEGPFTVLYTFTFAHVIDGYKVIWDDRCNISFSEDGLQSIDMTFYDYEKYDEVDILSFKEANDKIKSPDVFGLDNEDFKGKIKKLKVEKSGLVYVNQCYSYGIDIIQPVITFIGTAYSDSSESRFTARIKAIPKKYTYDIKLTDLS